MIASSGFLENALRQFSRKEGVTVADRVETLGVDLRTRVKKLGAQARRKKLQGEVLTYEKNEAFQKSYIKVGGKKLLQACMMPKRTWRVHAVEMSPTERLQIRRQMAAAADKKRTTSLSFFISKHTALK